MATLIAVHLGIIVRQKHTQFPGPGRTERNVVGSALWPGYALRSLSLLFAVAGVLLLLGGLVQINPIWLYGPYHTYAATNGAQPDWYVGWLIGALRLMPPLEIHAFGYTLVPNPFFGGALFPLIVFGLLYFWPALERRISGDHARHELLDRPRDVPWRTATISAFFSWVTVVFLAGSQDQLALHFHFSYVGLVWFFRVASIVVPFIVFFLVRRAARELKETELHPLRLDR
jgi:ubiquinol-cytochrome c reductase cytochrome b subunit